MGVLKPFNFFCVLFGFGWILFLLLTFLNGYEGSFLMINHVRIPPLDIPMQLLSWMGNGGTAAFICWATLRNKSIRILWIALLSLLLSGILSQLLKNFVFPLWHRPILFFEGKAAVHFFSGQDFRFNSFPSGHATTAAAMGFLLALYAANTIWKSVLIFLLTFGIGYSRVYNGLHFPGDVVAGWLLGFVCSALIAFYFRNASPFPENSRAARVFFFVIAALVLLLFAYEVTRFPELAWSF